MSLVITSLGWAGGGAAKAGPPAARTRIVVATRRARSAIMRRTLAEIAPLGNRGAIAAERSGPAKNSTLPRTPTPPAGPPPTRRARADRRGSRRGHAWRTACRPDPIAGGGGDRWGWGDPAAPAAASGHGSPRRDRRLGPHG